MQPSNDTLVPISYARSVVVITLSVVLLLIVAGGILAGAYFLSLHAIDVNQATQHALILRETQSQLRAAIPTCRALGQLSRDANTILNLPGVKNAPPSAHPLISFFKDFKNVYIASNCDKVLAFAKTVKQ